MDYSASIHDQDHPAAASPWGNSPSSSPQHSRTTFGSGLSGAPPPSPPRFASQQSSNGFGHDSEDGGPFGEEHSTAEPSQTSTTESVGKTDDTAESQQETMQDGGEDGESAADTRSPTQQIQRRPQTVAKHRPEEQQAPRKPAGPIYKLQAKITGLERTGKKDPIFRFDVHTNSPKFRTTQFRDVRRMHSEFVKLAEHLISANPEAMVPAVPQSVTSAGAGTDEDETRVKALMQRWLNVVCSNEILIRDDEMVLFVESDFGYSPMVKKKQPATGVRRKILKQFAPPPDSTPELSEARPIVKLFYLGAMDAGHKVDKLVKSRRGLGQAESEFGLKLADMHVQEPHPGLASAYRKLGKIVQTAGDYHQAQATAEATTLGDPFQYHSSDAFIVKETLTNRQILIREFVQAQETSRNKMNAADRLRASSNVRREKVDEAIAALEEAKQNETYLANKTTRVSQNLVSEQRKWFFRTAKELRASIRECAVREIEAERRTLAVLESVRPDVRAIDASGGLSRLGREAHPIARRANLAASQGPKGDAWSGVPRRAAGRDSISGSLGALPTDDKDGVTEQATAATPAGRPGGKSLAPDEDDQDRIDARNAASRLATSTF